MTALDSADNPVAESRRGFVVPAPTLIASTGASVRTPYPFSIRLQFRHWSDLPGYRTLLDKASPKTHLRSYADFSLGFHQKWSPSGAVELSERIVFLSNIGLGAEISPWFRILKNGYFTLDPWARARYCWYATGIGQRTSQMVEAVVGLDVALMPAGNLVFSAAWIPVHRIEYGILGDGAAVMNGWGFEAGIKVFVPRTVMGNPKIHGTVFDFQRIPLTFTAGRIEDRNTGIRLVFQKIGIAYLF